MIEFIYILGLDIALVGVISMLINFPRWLQKRLHSHRYWTALKMCITFKRIIVIFLYYSQKSINNHSQISVALLGCDFSLGICYV